MTKCIVEFLIELLLPITRAHNQMLNLYFIVPFDYIDISLYLFEFLSQLFSDLMDYSWAMICVDPPYSLAPGELWI